MTVSVRSGDFGPTCGYRPATVALRDYVVLAISRSYKKDTNTSLREIANFQA